MKDSGLLESTWEDAVTGEGEKAYRTEAQALGADAVAERQGFTFDISDNVMPDGAVHFNEGAFDVNPLSGETSESDIDNGLIALYGPRLSAGRPYDWQTGGCYGAAIHEAGVAGAE